MANLETLVHVRATVPRRVRIVLAGLRVLGRCGWVPSDRLAARIAASLASWCPIELGPGPGATSIRKAKRGRPGRLA